MSKLSVSSLIKSSAFFYITISSLLMSAQAEDKRVVEVGNNACGRVSVFFTPPKALDFYPAAFYTINGEGVLRSRHSFKLPLGKHRIRLHEQIDDFRLLRRSQSIVQSKELVIEVEQDTTYYLAAKFDSKEKMSLDNKAKWEPVVWKQVKSSCDNQ